jgi:DNA polymerase-3 subunit beta
MSRIVFKREDLLKAVEYGMNSIEKKSTMPILSHMMLEAVKGKARIITTNLDTAIIATVTATDYEGDIRLAIPARHFHDICRVTRGETVKLELEGDQPVLSITSGKTNYTLPCGEVNDFPAVQSEPGEEVIFPIKRILPLFKKIQFSMTEPAYNKTYSGVLFIRSTDGDKQVLDLVTTDIHRISIVTVEALDLPIKEIGEGVVIPGRNFADIGKIFADENEVRMSIKDGKLFMISSAVTFICRLIKNEFPSYRNVTGTSAQIEKKEHALVNRKELIEGIKRVIALSTEEKIWAARFEFKGDTLKMSASSEFGGSSSDEILVEKAFPADRAIGLNARYFLDVIAVIDDEAVRLIVEEGLRPLTILEKTPEFTYTHMVMPLRI